jgi:hypothetical protein
VSGNPSGRPRSYENVAALALTFTRDAIETLARIATNRKAPAAAQVSAAE